MLSTRSPLSECQDSLGETLVLGLVGDVQRTFLWDRPTLFLPESIGIGERNAGLRQLLDKLDGGSLLRRA